MSESRFFRRTINYSACNEDPGSELRAFSGSATQHVFCILGGGERFFNLLTAEQCGSKFVLLDANKTQIFLFELKRAAYLELDFKEFSEFIGLSKTSGRARVATYSERLRSALSPQAGEFWDRQRRLIRSGVLYQGKFERFLRLISWVLRAVYGRTLEKLFDCRSIEDQRRYFKQRIAGRRWSIVMWLLCRQIWFRILSRDPAFYQHAGIASYFEFYIRRFEYAITELPVRENFLLSLIFNGRYRPESGAVPRCYSREKFALVKARMSSVSVEPVCNDLHAYLAGPGVPRFDAFSLSDVMSYMTIAQATELAAVIGKSIGESGRVVLRQLLTRYDGDQVLKDSAAALSRNRQLEAQLDTTDTSFVWSFVVFDAPGRSASSALPSQVRDAALA